MMFSFSWVHAEDEKTIDHFENEKKPQKFICEDKDCIIKCYQDRTGKTQENNIGLVQTFDMPCVR